MIKASQPNKMSSKCNGLNISPPDRVGLIVERLGELQAPDLAEVQSILGRLSDDMSPEDIKECLHHLENVASAEACFVKAFLHEMSGDFRACAELLDSFSLPRLRVLEVLRLQGLARNLIHTGKFQYAIAPLKRAVRLSDSYRSLTASARLLRMLGRVGREACRRTVRVAIIGNATFDLLVPLLRVIGFSYGIDFELLAGAYNQHVQEVLDPASKLGTFKPEVLIIATDVHALGLPEESDHPKAVVAARLEELCGFWASCQQKFSCFVIQHNFAVPEISAFGRLSASLPGGRARLIRELNLELEYEASKRGGLAILDVEQIASIIGKQIWEDEKMWITAKQYPSARAMVSLCKNQVALVRSAVGLASKCIVLDLDGTLWGGVIGEDGLSGIQLGGSPEGEAYASFQRYLRGLRQRGVILSVCSKNNESDAILPFEAHPDMILRRDDISLLIANWKPKPENLQEIAKRLNIGLDSLVFVDDNPTEREFVRNRLPEVEVPELPSDPSQFASALHRELLFEGITLTREDRERAESYQANLQRQNFESSSGSLEDFLSGLQMQINLKPFDALNEARIVQLINKTNQFNLTTKRMTDSEVRAYAASNSNYTQFVQLKDRFGDNGITGILMASAKDDSLKIDQWLISCRVLGRQVEQVMLSALWNYARSFGYRSLEGIYVPTAKNSQVADLYDRLGFECTGQESNSTRLYKVNLTHEYAPPRFFLVDDQTNKSKTAST
jgi:FkbH-like protein